MQGKPRWILSGRMVKGEGKSLWAVRCKLLALGAGNGSPIPTNLGTSRPLIWHGSMKALDQLWHGHREAQWDKMNSSRWEASSPVSQSHLYIMLCLKEK